MKNYGEEHGWEIGVDFPEWANTEVYVKTISKGYYWPEKNQKMHIGEYAQRLLVD